MAEDYKENFGFRIAAWEEIVIMYHTNCIRNILKDYIDKSVDKFIIYPFGVNGVAVKNVLKDYFNLTPCLIVDNEASKYNSEIINGEELKRIYKGDMYVVITVENNAVNEKICDEISQFVPAENVINLHTEDKISEENIYDGRGFLLQDFLPISNCTLRSSKESGRIKVRIVHRSATTWNAISTICHAFRCDDFFDLLLIVHTDWTREQSIEQVKGEICDGGGVKYNYVTWDEYKVEADRPDILIIGSPWNEVIDGLVNIREYAKLVIVAYWSVVRYDPTVEGFLLRTKNALGIYRPDYYLFDSLQYKELKDLDFFAGKIIEMGNAKFDGIYHTIKKKQYPVGWEKLKNRKVVLWLTSHGMGNDKTIGRTLTFDIYAKTIFEYMDTNQGMGMIFRPSIGLIREMIQFGFWSHNDIERFKKYCSDSPNIVYDERDTYDTSYSLADGILTEAFGGSVCSALPMLKPICACYRSKGDIPWHKELLDSLYSAYTSQDVVDFFDMLNENRDPMFNIRKEASERFVKHFDGKNGWRIKEFIKEKYFEMV